MKRKTILVFDWIGQQGVCQPILFVLFMCVAWQVSGQSGVSQAEITQGEATADIGEPLPPLSANPQPACQSNENAGPEMVVIPGGYFLMGSPNTEQDRNDVEGPQHWVAVQPFSVGRCEVTKQEFERFTRETEYQTSAEQQGECSVLGSSRENIEQNTRANWRKPGYEQSGSDPITCISYQDAMAYIVWLNQRTGVRYRLPTEAEWEYVARATSAKRFSFGDDPGYSQLCDYSNIADQSLSEETFASGWPLAKCSDGFKYTAPVAGRLPNGFGIYDMHGNLWEWVHDCWHKNYENAPNGGGAWMSLDDGDCTRHVLRGGSWDIYPGGARSAYRVRYGADDAYDYFGFRLARTLIENEMSDAAAE